MDSYSELARRCSLNQPNISSSQFSPDSIRQLITGSSSDSLSGQLGHYQDSPLIVSKLGDDPVVILPNGYEPVLKGAEGGEEEGAEEGEEMGEEEEGEVGEEEEEVYSDIIDPALDNAPIETTV